MPPLPHEDPSRGGVEEVGRGPPPGRNDRRKAGGPPGASEAVNTSIMMQANGPAPERVIVIRSSCVDSALPSPSARGLTLSRAYAAGSSTLKRVPCPTALSTSMRPPRSLTSRRTIESPSPVPCGFVV